MKWEKAKFIHSHSFALWLFFFLSSPFAGTIVLPLLSVKLFFFVIRKNGSKITALQVTWEPENKDAFFPRLINNGSARFCRKEKKSSLILQRCKYLQYKKCRPRKLCCKLAKWRVLSLSTLANSQHRLSFKFSELFHQGASKNWGISRLGREGGERKEEEEDEKKKPNFLPRGQLEHKQFDFDIYLSAASQSVSPVRSLS